MTLYIIISVIMAVIFTRIGFGYSEFKLNATGVIAIIIVFIVMVAVWPLFLLLAIIAEIKNQYEARK
jgi:hypothetical protein